MKKIILLATMLLVAGTVSAQTYFNGDRADYDFYYQTRWSFEVNANLSNATNGTNFNTGNLPGFSLGFDADIPTSHSLSIVPGLLFSQKGFTASTPSGDLTQRVEAMEFPVLAKFRSGKFVNFSLGPQVSYIVSTNNTYGKGFPIEMRDKYVYSGSNLRYQGVLGVGIDVNKSLSIHARYSFDLTNTYSNGNVAYVPNHRNKVFQLGFGINI